MKISESRYPNFFIGVGIVTPIVLIAVYVFAIYNNDNIKDILLGAAIFAPIILTILIITLMWSGYKITYNDDGTFTYRNYFWKSKTYRYADVEPKYISENKTEYFIDGKKILTVAYYITNGNALDRHIKNAKRNKRRNAETDNETKNRVVFSKQPLMIFGVGLTMFIIGATLLTGSILSFFFDDYMRRQLVWALCLYTVPGIAAFIAGVYCLMLYSFWQVRYYEETFTYRNWFGVKRAYRYDEVSAVADDPVKTFFYRNGKKILMMRYIVTYPDELYIRIKKANKKEII